jgi:hypothetical protein
VYVYFEEETGRRSAAKLLSKDEARRIAVNCKAAGATPPNIIRANSDVCYWRQSGHCADVPRRPRLTQKGHERPIFRCNAKRSSRSLSSLLNCHADLDAQGGVATSIVFLHRQSERVLPLIAGCWGIDNGMALRRCAAMRWLRDHCHAVENSDATRATRGVVPTDPTRLAAGNSDHRRAGATPGQVWRLGFAGRHRGSLIFLVTRLTGARDLRAGLQVERAGIWFWRYPRGGGVRRPLLRISGIAEAPRRGAAIAGCIRARRLSVNGVAFAAVHSGSGSRSRTILRRSRGLLASVAGGIANIARLGDRGRCRVADVGRLEWRSRGGIANIGRIVTGGWWLRRRRTGWDWDDHGRCQHRGAWR